MKYTMVKVNPEGRRADVRCHVYVEGGRTYISFETFTMTPEDIESSTLKYFPLGGGWIIPRGEITRMLRNVREREVEWKRCRRLGKGDARCGIFDKCQWCPKSESVQNLNTSQSPPLLSSCCGAPPDDGGVDVNNEGYCTQCGNPASLATDDYWEAVNQEKMFERGKHDTRRF